MKYLSIILGIFLFFVLVFSAMSLEPPLPGELEKYKKDGSYETRLKFAKSLGNDKFDPALIKNKKAQMEAMASGATLNTSALPYPIGLPSSGTPRMFVLLIEFPDYRHSNEPSVFANKIFGDGISSRKGTEFPYESLKNYYYRSSYGDLTITGSQADVYGWYMAQHNRDYYGKGGVPFEDHKGAYDVIKEALAYYDPMVDFSQYDNSINGVTDGVIDYFAVFWTGPDTGWATLWWGWCGNYGDNSVTVDEKTLGRFSWQWESRTGNSTFEPRTLIHETGHALGVPDYYDYDSTVGPDGGVGGLDMMAGNWGDHNCFSKWLLGWVTPTIVNELSLPPPTIQLRDSAANRDCVAVMPGLSTAGMFSEYFMVQNRSRVGNDSLYPTNGLLIWHVDARLDGNNFAWNNSYTDHKLLRLMEADGLEEIESSRSANAGDFYDGADFFSPISKPNSNNYLNSSTGVIVNKISAGGVIMNADIKIGSGTSVSVSNYRIQNGAASTNTRTVTLDHYASGSPTHYMASESPTFSGASWIAYTSNAPLFTLSSKNGTKWVYFKVKNEISVSPLVSDDIYYGRSAAPMATFVTAAQDPFPNPFNPEVWIPFTLSKAENVIIRIYSANGLLIRTLDLGQKLPGNYLASEKAGYWNGRNEAGEKVSSGPYFYTIKAGDFFATKKLVIAK